ncbi:MAG TPA: TrkA family potassium uptake protein [Spirochaetota bacterium]|nr:TrkA family potassium uptake protein [Spirochaetota bacterium]HOK92384.1 TrkA family potassium uptake protein [Spirochaetota bacterium]HPD77835.1 TrkA family potassium uptake protein [Spirochaetota bacterium]HPP94803.1 TrkA family potassium uptake protein [Spirochaetota bacterium]HRS62990.1 TrkA family potassium uptake protein [Spirochaetota bacterium]
MKKFAVIGLGNFGMNIARSLVENNCEVLGIDIDKNTVDKAKDFLTYAITGNPANKAILDSLGLNEYDAVILSIGQEMVSSILISLYLKEAKVKKIIARAISEDHEKILKQLGVDTVIFPEKEMAIRIGKAISMRNAVDYLPLSEEYAIVEVAPPESFIGKSLRELNIGARFRCQILGIKSIADDLVTEDKPQTTVIAPSADEVIQEGNILIVLGKTAAIERMEKSS